MIPEENKIIGYSTKNSGGVPENFKNYFVIQFDKPFTFVSTVFENNILPNETEAKGNHTGAVIGFATKKEKSYTHVLLPPLSAPNRRS